MKFDSRKKISVVEFTNIEDCDITDTKNIVEDGEIYTVKTYMRGYRVYAVKYLNGEKQIHRKNGPALTFYNKNKVTREIWYRNGLISRVGAPAIKLYKDGNLYLKVFAINGVVGDQGDFPARIYYFDGKISSIVHAKNSIVHRENGPAIIRFSDNRIISKEFYENGHYRTFDKGPGKIEFKDDGKLELIEYYNSGSQIHRDKGPARVSLKIGIVTKTEILRIEYRNNMKYNRLDGPALIRIDTSTGEKLGERFFIDDKEYDEFQYEIVKASKTFEEKV